MLEKVIESLITKKFLTEIKNIFNALNDRIQNLAIKEKNDFRKRFEKFIFTEKKAKIDIIGEKENKDFEKFF